jgi:hypothetical protein
MWQRQTRRPDAAVVEAQRFVFDHGAGEPPGWLQQEDARCRRLRTGVYFDQSATGFGENACWTIIPRPETGSWTANQVPFQSVTSHPKYQLVPTSVTRSVPAASGWITSEYWSSGYRRGMYARRSKPKGVVPNEILRCIRMRLASGPLLKN